MKKIKAILLAMAMVATLSGLALAQNRDYNDDNRYQNDRDRDRDDYRGNHRNDDDNYSWGRDRNNDAREYGFHNGYRAGYMQGRNVRNSRGRYGNWNNGQWGSGTSNQSDTSGYERWMGSQGQYKKAYRDGYHTGYSDAYNGRRSQYRYTYGQNGQRTPWDPDGDGRPGYNNGGYNDGQYGNGQGNGNAQRYGYQDGVELGQRDRNSRHSYRPTEWKAYKDADHGMSSSNGYRSSDDYKREYRAAFMNGYSQGYGR